MSKLIHFYSRRFFAGMLLTFLLATQSLDATTIRVLLVYDTTAKTWADQNGGMALFSADTVAKMNQATTNSGINLTFELACATNVAYTYSSFNTDLPSLQAGTNGLAVVHRLRNAYSADVVALFVDTGSPYGNTGRGYILSTTNGSPAYPFTIDAIQAVALGHTLTHEFGHNLGCGHSKYQISETGPNTDLNTYSAGWYFYGTNTIHARYSV